ncbi:hypothetical protein AB664_04310 [Brucella anthropi]|uniref:Uncharacterized protein n=1 Tax=Brucella anthropi TaxID=529 RepID=A0A656Z5L8_BRUAN|nr:hypothetical protein AB664_04310 [Brucella anthropi]
MAAFALRGLLIAIEVQPRRYQYWTVANNHAVRQKLSYVSILHSKVIRPVPKQSELPQVLNQADIQIV